MRIDWFLVTSAEYRALAHNAAAVLEAISRSRLHARRRARMSPSHDDARRGAREAHAGAKKGLAIQRYKGLGEMNPSSSGRPRWTPTKRRLLQVQIEDAVEADAIFTMLMGDQVEPRREFIEENALNVRNLDV